MLEVYEMISEMPIGFGPQYLLIDCFSSDECFDYIKEYSFFPAGSYFYRSIAIPKTNSDHITDWGFKYKKIGRIDDYVLSLTPNAVDDYIKKYLEAG